MKKRIKRLQNKPKQQELILRTLIDNLPDGIFLKDRDSRFIFANQVIATLMGVPDPEALLGKTDHDFYPKEVADTFLANERAVMESRQPLINREESTPTSGKLRRLTTKVPVLDTHGEVTGLLGITRDITERREVEEELRRTEQRYRDLMEQAADGVFLLDKNYNFLMANSEFCRMSGYRSEELLGLNILDTYQEELRDVARARNDRIKSGEKLRFERTIKTKDGLLFTAEMSTRRLTDGTMLGIAHDITEHKRFEEALRESEENFRAIFTEAPVGIFRSTFDGKLISANPAFARMLGYDSPEQLIETVNEKGAAEVVYADPTQRSHVIEDMERSPGWLKIQNRYRHRNGRVVIVNLMTRVRISPDSLRKELEGFVEDITERIEAETALARERAFLTALMDNIPDYIYFKDRESRFVLNNKAHAQALGAGNPSEMLGKTDFDYFALEHAQKAFDDEQRIIRTGQPLVGAMEETKLKRPTSWVSSTKMPLRDEKGAIVGTFGVTRDMTEHRQMEQKNLRLATLVDSSDDAIVGTDLERKITVWNKGAERIYGYSAEEVLGTTLSPLIPPEYEKETRLVRERVMLDELVTNFETVRLRKGGSRITVSMTISAIRDPEGKIVGMASTARDITTQKALEAQLNRAQRLESLATLARGVAHQFNNINAAISGYLQMLQSEKDLPPRPASYVEAACAGVQKAVNITDRLLVLTEPGSASESLRLDVLARSVLPLHEKRIENEKVRLVLDLAECPLVAGSEKSLKFVLASLIDNALDSLIDRPERVLGVRTGSTETAAYFAVEDSGCGIAAEDLPRIFSPFFSAKGEWAPTGSPQARLRGVGLSLAICSRFISECGGRIDVQSTRGAGSTFHVWFPAATSTLLQKNQNAS